MAGTIHIFNQVSSKCDDSIQNSKKFNSMAKSQIRHQDCQETLAESQTSRTVISNVLYDPPASLSWIVKADILFLSAKLQHHNQSPLFVLLQRTFRDLCKICE